MIEQKSVDDIVAKRPSKWLGHGEGLNLKINEEPVQLNDSISDRTEVIGHLGVLGTYRFDRLLAQRIGGASRLGL